MAVLVHTLLLAVCANLLLLPLGLAHHARAMDNGISYDGPHSTSAKIEFGHFDAKKHARTNRQAPTGNMNQTISDHHDYYTSTFHGPGAAADALWLDLSQEAQAEEVDESGISDLYLFYEVRPLPFDFPIYGHTINNIAVTTSGFLYTGTIFHQLIHLTQYIAPLQANFNPSLNDSSRIFVLSTSERFTVQWDNVHSHDHVEAGTFSFQVSLFPSGEIHFVYRQMPLLVSEISDAAHPVEVGLSDSFYIFGPFSVSIFEYSRIQLSSADNLTNSAYVITPLLNCITAASCSECSLITVTSNFSCGWCESLQRCSDGLDRFRQEWTSAGCSTSNVTQCATPNPTDGTSTSTGVVATQPDGATTNPTDGTSTSTGVVTTQPDGATPNPTDGTSTSTGTSTGVVTDQLGTNEEEALSTGTVAGIAVGVIVLLLLAALVLVVMAVLLYGYRHPDSGIGLKMIEHRPKAWSLRKDKSASYDVKTGKMKLEEEQ